VRDHDHFDASRKAGRRERAELTGQRGRKTMAIIRDQRCGSCGSRAAWDDSFCGCCGNSLQGWENGRRRAAPGDPLPLPPADLATRHLCATTYLDEEYADFVAGQLVDSRHRAIHPCPGVNLLAVTRHAAMARAAARRRGFQLAMIRVIALVFLVVLATKGRSTELFGLPGICLLLPLGLAAIAAIVSCSFASRWLALSRTLEIMDPDLDPERLATAVDRPTERKLTALESSNVIVFSGLSHGITPFTGSGKQISSWSITMDIASAGCDDDGGLRRIERFDAADLHDWLAREVPDNTLPGLTSSERLYVSGVSAPLVPHLVPKPRRAPRPRIPDAVLTNVLRSPTDYARTYLCFEKCAWGGQFVFSYLFRAEILRKTLFVEGVALAMLPLADRFCGAERIPVETSARISYCLRSIVPDLLVALLGRILARLVRVAAKRPSAEGRQPTPGTDMDVVVDYGAINSIRALAATDKMPWYFVSVDEEMYLSVLQRRILENTVRFLREHGVDTSEFERQQTKIINRTHFGNILNIGNVSGSGNVFGDNARVTNQRSGGGGGGR
jgi:hypothetical protein